MKKRKIALEIQKEKRRESIRKSAAKARKIKRAQGLVQRDVWARPEDWPKIKKLEKELQEQAKKKLWKSAENIDS